jgi:hypothetical protein
MNATGNTLASIPLFRHCTDEEIRQLQNIGKLVTVKQGHQFDMKKVNSFYVVVNGIFEIESMGKTDIVYLAPGSFFGSIPFTENRQTGKVRALVDSTLMMLGVEEMYRFFLMSYKCLRGYLKIISRMGYEVSGIGKKYSAGASRIIMVYSSFPQSGKSFLASLLGASLKKNGKTVVLDMSFSGNSVFNFFEKKAAAPLAHRTEDSPAFERLINERMEHVSENLNLLNVTFGSKVKVDPDIVSPLLFMLSREYRYIVIDCGDDDLDLRNRLLGLSDRIFTLVKNQKETRILYDIFDANVKEGQRVYYIINEHYAGDVKDFSGGLVLPKFMTASGQGGYERLERIADGDELSPIVSLITDRRSALVFETNLLLSIFYGGFLGSLHKAGKTFDLMYTSSYGYIVLSLYLLSGGKSEFRKRMEQLFSPERLNKLLDITFPSEYVFKKDVISKLAGEICGENRLEMFREMPVAMLGRNGMEERRLFSTGYLRDMITASFCLYPIFEQVEILGGRYNSGYPDFRVRVEDLFRVDVDETVYVSVDNSMTMSYRDGKLMNFFSGYLSCVEERAVDDKVSDLSDVSMVLEVSEKDIRLDRIYDSSLEIADKLLKKLNR